MRLHRIALTNLNSLEGRHVVDFDGELAGSTLFLIHGPTGAGKSTLLDAISLALFGVTPRLRTPVATSKDDTDLEAQDARRCMTRGTASASVDLVFSRLAPEGRRYFRATWSVQRAHRRPDGKLKAPRRAVTELEVAALATIGEQEPLAGMEKKKDYEAAFEDALDGLTPDDFERSVLLAQGQFASLLHADTKSQVNLLERMTDTGDYRAIGARAARKRSETQERVRALEEGLKSIDRLEDVERAQLEAAAEALKELEERGAGARSEVQTLREGWAALEAAEAAQREVDEKSVDLEARRSTAATVLERLARHERLAPVAALLEEEDRAKLGTAEAAGAKEAAEASQREAVERRDAAALALKEAEGALAAANQSARARAPAIAAAREARAVFRQAEGKALDARERVARAEHVVKTRHDGLEALASQLAAARERRDTTEEAWRTWSAWHALVEDDADLEAARRALAPLRSAVQAWQAEVDALASIERELEELDTEIKASAPRLSTLQDAKDAAERHLQSLQEEMLSACGEGQTFAEAQDAVLEDERAMRRRQQALGRALEERKAIEELDDEIAEAKRSAERDEERLQAAQEAVTRTEDAFEAIDKALRVARDQLWLASQATLFAEARSKLVELEPCPVCGAQEHPWTGMEREDDARLARLVQEARTAVESLEAREKERNMARREAHAHRSGLAASVEAARRQATVLGARRKEVQAAFEQGLEPLGLEASSDSAALESLGVVLEGELARLEARHASLQALASRRDDARRALEEAGENLRRSRETVQQVEANRGLRVRDCERALERQKEAETLCASTLEALQRRVEALPRNLEALASDAATDEGWHAKVRAWEACLRELDRDLRHARSAREKRGAAREELAPLETAHEAADRELAGSRQTLETEARTHQALEDAARAAKTVAEGHLDGVAPDVVEEALRQAVERAESEQDRCREAAEAANALAEKEVANARVAQERHDVAAKAHAKRQREAAQALAEHGCSADEVRAQVMEAEAAREIATVRDALLEERVRLRARKESADERAEKAAVAWRAATEALPALAGRLDALRADTLALVEAHERLAQPESLQEEAAAVATSFLKELESGASSDVPAGLAALVGWAQRLATDISTLRGAVQAAVQDDDVRRRRVSDKERELAEARATAEVWQQLSELIGTRSGEQFAEFAQALNLGRILLAANGHLQRLQPRYALVQRRQDGVPTLEMEIADLQRGGEARPLVTLSGGETFLVSLALALGLADMRVGRLRLETLLLDEGFGTLDAETLHVAIAALEQLQAQGYRVGVISHVSALKERIAAQIEVVPVGAGRSRLEVRV